MTLAQWINEFSHNPSRDRDAWNRFTHDIDSGALLWDVQELALKLRLDVARKLYQQQQYRMTPNPRKDIPFSYRRVLVTACEIAGVNVIPARTEAEFELLRHLDPDNPHPVAILQAYPARPDGSQQPPEIVIDFHHDDTAIIFVGACLLGEYLYKRPMLEGVATRYVPLTLPPPDHMLTPYLHMFAKALLCLHEEFDEEGYEVHEFDERCPYYWDCAPYCNGMLDQLEGVPPSHRQATGVMEGLNQKPALPHREGGTPELRKWGKK